jgi:hypothetical protein
MIPLIDGSLLLITMGVLVTLAGGLLALCFAVWRQGA